MILRSLFQARTIPRVLPTRFFSSKSCAACIVWLLIDRLLWPLTPGQQVEQRKYLATRAFSFLCSFPTTQTFKRWKLGWAFHGLFRFCSHTPLRWRTITLCCHRVYFPGRGHTSPLPCLFLLRTLGSRLWDLFFRCCDFSGIPRGLLDAS